MGILLSSLPILLSREDYGRYCQPLVWRWEEWIYTATPFLLIFFTVFLEMCLPSGSPKRCRSGKTKVKFWLCCTMVNLSFFRVYSWILCLNFFFLCWEHIYKGLLTPWRWWVNFFPNSSDQVLLLLCISSVLRKPGLLLFHTRDTWYGSILVLRTLLYLWNHDHHHHHFMNKESRGWRHFSSSAMFSSLPPPRTPNMPLHAHRNHHRLSHHLNLTPQQRSTGPAPLVPRLPNCNDTYVNGSLHS